MDKSDLIDNLKANNYSFEDKGDQITIKLARRHFLKLYIANDTVVKSKDIFKQFRLLTYGKSLKAATWINMIAYLICISPFVLMCIFNPYFFSNGGKYFFIMLAPLGLQPLLEFWYYNKRLLKIKKLLNLND